VTSSRRILFVSLTVVLGMIALAGGGALAYYLRHKATEVSADAGADVSEADAGPVGQVFPGLKSEELLPKFKPSIEGVDWELMLAKPFQQSGKTYAVAVFATYDLDDQGKRVDAHANGANLCPALFVQESSGGWRCLEFKDDFTRAGSWGNSGDVELVRLGPDRWGLSVTTGFTNQGVTSSSASYYEFGRLPETGATPTLQLKDVLDLTNSLDNGGVVDDGDAAESWGTKTAFLPKVVNEHFVISVQPDGELPEGSEAPVGTYEFSPAAGIYKKQ
jgi:hypothetical protein